MTEAIYVTPEMDARVETLIKAVPVCDGTELHDVGCLPRHVSARLQAAHLNNKISDY